MLRLQFYTDMHGIDFFNPPVEERMTLINIMTMWHNAWREDDMFVYGNLMIPAREIRYMEIVEVQHAPP